MATRRTDSFVSTVHAEAVRVAQEHGVEEARAIQIAARLVESVSTRYQGIEPYVGKMRYDRGAVLRDFDGRNHQQVCSEHHISRSTLYRILRQNRRALRGPIED